MSLDDDTLLESYGASSYTAEVTDGWDAMAGSPNGGYLLALAVRALAH